MKYIPSSIWKEEVEIRNKARHRMTAISNAQEFYKELTGKYTMDGEHLFKLVECIIGTKDSEWQFNMIQAGSTCRKFILSSYPVFKVPNTGQRGPKCAQQNSAIRLSATPINLG